MFVDAMTNSTTMSVWRTRQVWLSSSQRLAFVVKSLLCLAIPITFAAGHPILSSPRDVEDVKINHVYTKTDPRPACPKTFEPVCGCDSVTYSNACFAAAAGMSIEHNSPCNQECNLQSAF